MKVRRHHSRANGPEDVVEEPWHLTSRSCRPKYAEVIDPIGLGKTRNKEATHKTAHADKQADTDVQLAVVRIDAATAYCRPNTYLLQKRPGQCPNLRGARANAPTVHTVLMLYVLLHGLR